MQADIFYATNADNVKKIILLTKNEYQSSIFSDRIKAIFLEQKFTGNSGEVVLIMNTDGLLECVYLGLGDEENIEQALANLVTIIPQGSYKLDKKVSDEALLIWSLAQYKFNIFKKLTLAPRVLLLNNPNILQRIINKASSIFLVRDLINMPANKLDTKELSIVAAKLAKSHDAKFYEIVGEDLIKENFPAIYTVGQASASKPRLLSLSWGDNKNPLVTLVGKGVCFDSGGLDLKTSDGMRLMKKDMGGAAHVLGLANWIMNEHLPIKLQVLIPAVENSVSGNAYRPGDVLTMRNGMTVEIDNTDAEGRLVVADAITRACEDNPDILFDFATLTGAARVAVGTDIAAMFCNNNELANDILEISENISDPIWRMPLFSRYRSLFESAVADMANSAKSSYGGAITAALFIENYVTKGIKWMHFDIMAWNLIAKPGRPVGGEAMAIMAVGEYLLKRYKKA